MKRPKNELGHFVPKSEDDRKVRSIRATDEIWESLGQWADEQCITRADLLELIVKNRRNEESEKPCNTTIDYDKILSILQESLTYKSNAGGAIKAKIREVMELIANQGISDG